jgi:hypothetical protein
VYFSLIVTVCIKIEYFMHSLHNVCKINTSLEVMSICLFLQLSTCSSLEVPNEFLLNLMLAGLHQNLPGTFNFGSVMYFM